MESLGSLKLLLFRSFYFLSVLYGKYYLFRSFCLFFRKRRKFSANCSNTHLGSNFGSDILCLQHERRLYYDGRSNLCVLLDSDVGGIICNVHLEQSCASADSCCKCPLVLFVFGLRYSADYGGQKTRAEY